MVLVTVLSNKEHLVGEVKSLGRHIVFLIKHISKAKPVGSNILWLQ